MVGFCGWRTPSRKIAREGYVKKYYDYGYHYKYKEQIIKADKQAQKEKRGIYQ